MKVVSYEEAIKTLIHLVAKDITLENAIEHLREEAVDAE